MDLASINAAITGLRFAKDTFQTMLGMKIEAATQSAVVDGMSKVVTAQETILRLQAETEQLRQDLKARDDWDARAARYSLTETPGRAIVWESSFAPKHYACPVCFEKRAIHFLQDRRGDMGWFDCRECKASFSVGVPRSRQIGGPGPSRFPREF
jgi:hypothetical protein